VAYISITRQSYLVVGHLESLANKLLLLLLSRQDVRQLHPQVFIVLGPIGPEAPQEIVQIALVIVVVPRRGYHHQVDRVRRVNQDERTIILPFADDVPQCVSDSGIHYQRDDRDENDGPPPCRRLAVPSHGRERLIATQRDQCVSRNSAWVRRKCGSEELECG
jgi:hypothetical protein